MTASSAYLQLHDVSAANSTIYNLMKCHAMMTRDPYNLALT